MLKIVDISIPLMSHITSTAKSFITSVQVVYFSTDDLADPDPATSFAYLIDTTVQLVLLQNSLFTPLLIKMLAVGEETGQADEVLQEVALFYERDVAFDLKSLTAKIEPILIVIVAVMVLILALGIFTPMWDMLNAYKKR